MNDAHYKTKYHSPSQGSLDEQLAAILDTITDGFFVIDAEWRFSYLNATAERYLGLPREKAVGRNYWEVYPATLGTLLEREYRRAADGEMRDFDYFYQPWGCWFNNRCFPRQGGGVTVYFQDITDHKRAEETLRRNHDEMGQLVADRTGALEHTLAALKASEEKYRSLVESISDCIWEIDSLGNFSYLSPRFEDLVGHATAEFIGRSPAELIIGKGTDQVEKKFREALEVRGEGKPREHLVRHRDGRLITVEVHGTPKFSREGDYRGMRGIARDITKLRRAEEESFNLERQLLHAQKLESLGVLAGGIAHDFNNILTSVIGNVDVALFRLDPESPLRENLQRIRKSARRAADLAGQMLAYSGKGNFVVKPVDLNRLVRDVELLIESSVSKRTELCFNLASPLPSVKADATQIRQVIMNLVINASEAIGDQDGAITISSGWGNCSGDHRRSDCPADGPAESLYVFLEVKDTGCGFDKETQAKIFDPFFTTKFAGRGLGLAVVQGIVRGHKGSIRIDSEPGKGTVFRIMLPLGTGRAEQAPPPRRKAGFRGNGTVLLVDDEEDVRHTVKDMLQLLGYAVVTASDGREALAEFSKNPAVACVILDLTMPHLDGEQCFRELRLIDPYAKVIMSSGYSESECTRKFAGKVLAGFIQKPYTMSALSDVLQELVYPPHAPTESGGTAFIST